MSMLGSGRTRGLEGTPIGETVATFADYDRAQKTVSTLVAAEVPARDIAIVGLNLRSIERVTGRLGWATAARTGALNGILIGLFFAAVVVIGTPDAPIQLFVGVVFVGIAFGMLLSILSYSFVRRRRDYASVIQVVADHYEVTVAPASVHKARQALGKQATAGQAATATTPAQHTTGPAQPGTTPAPTPDSSAQPAAPGAKPTTPPAPAAGSLDEPPRYGERLPTVAAPAKTADGESAPRTAPTAH